MTDTNPAMTPARASEIVAAYGADARRWPEAERVAALVAAAADPALQAELAAAAAFDAELAAWAAAPVTAAPFDVTALPVATPARRWRWFGGGVAAAALAAGLVLFAPVARVVPPVPARIAQVPLAAPADSEAFASLFTPTDDEELLI